MKKTPLYDLHLDMGAKIVDFAGFQMPIQFAGIYDEHRYVRDKVGVFDVSHMGEIYIEGDDALGFLNYLLTNTIDGDKHNSLVYSCMCDENGMVVDDLIVYIYNPKKFLLVVNAANDEKDFEWLTEWKKKLNKRNLSIISKSSELGELAIQGPEAERALIKLLRDINSKNILAMTFFEFQLFSYMDEQIIVSRSGYTGEDGFEIFGKNDVIVGLYKELLAIDEPKVMPIGLGARDTLRFEAGLPLYGHEISEHIHPLSGGLKAFLDFSKSFIGSESLKTLDQLNDYPRKKGFKLLGKGIARDGYPIFNEEGASIGFVTTGYKLEDHDMALGMAIIEPEYIGNSDPQLYVGIRKKKIPIELCSPKFMIKRYKR